MSTMQRVVSERDSLHSRGESPSAPRQCYMACTREDLVDVLDEALSRGGEQARLDPSGVFVDTDAVFCRAEAACDEALRTYVALDERKFREVFTLAWSAGYRAERRSSSRAGSGSTTEGTKLHG